MLNLTSHKENAHQNHNKIPHHTRMSVIKMTENNTCQWECGEMGIPHTVLIGNAKWCGHFGKSAAVSQNVKRRVAVRPSNSTSRYLIKINESICLHKNLYSAVHSNIIHNSPKVETTQMSITFWTGKENVARPYNWMPLVSKKEWNTDANYNLNEPRKHDAVFKNPVTK